MGARAARRPAREGASRSFSRISRSTRRREVRIPPWRSLAHTLRWPSPWNGLAASTARIAPPGRRPASARPAPAAAGRLGAAARDDGRRSRGRRPRRGRPARDRTACRRTARWSGSSPRPPPGQRAAGLQGGDLLLQQLLPEQHLAEPCLQPLARERLAVGRAGREAASPAARKASRQAVSAAAVTPSERETVSRSSPRSSRSTASRLRGRDIRRPGPVRPHSYPSSLSSWSTSAADEVRLRGVPFNRGPGDGRSPRHQPTSCSEIAPEPNWDPHLAECAASDYPS